MSDLTPTQARLAFALLKIRKAQIDRALNRVTPFIDQEPGDKNAAKLGAARLGKVAMTEPEVKPIVVDRAAFTAWVEQHAATEVERVPTVRSSYESKLLDEIAKRGAAVDPNGEEIPGVTLGYGSSPQQRFYADENAENLLSVVEAKDLPEIDGIDLAGLLGAQGGTS